MSTPMIPGYSDRNSPEPSVIDPTAELRVLRIHASDARVPQMFHAATIPASAVRSRIVSPSSWWEGL